MEVIPKQGVGEIKFGMKPAQLINLMGGPIGNVYQEWKDGNLNDGICYPGFLFIFDRLSVDAVPHENSNLVEIWANDQSALTLDRKPLFEMNRSQIVEYLDSKQKTYLFRDNNREIYVKEYEWEIAFDENGIVSIIWIYKVRQTFEPVY